MSEEAKKKKCFVVMGFGEKIDLATSRPLDLDKTYRIIIKKAVEEAGLECIRADEVIHSGTIDKPMYELLHEADVVIADLSTSNANAIYELGVRHALRPHTTIVMAEKQFKFPFDIGHLLIRTYEHLGKGIDAEEADKVREELRNAIVTLVEKQECDSPVFTFLPKLMPGGGDPAPAPAAAAPDETIAELMESFKEARADENWKSAARNLRKLHEKMPNDAYITQQLALAVYKGKQPDAESALVEARELLRTLNPEQTADPETLGLWGSVHKRLWELKKDQALLEEAIRAHEKGFYLKNDHYNGINFAFLLNARASVSPPREALADVVTAERVRHRVIKICRDELASGVGITDDKGQTDRHEKFWVQATLVEAYFGIGEREKAAELKEKAVAEAPESWMAGTLNEQLGKLEKYLDEQSSLTVQSSPAV
ncbi:MAG TPA: TRAFs-binding domain-containing protein [Pyrinomonadaceae bacterium]|jgi:tetratricopeptide (TPR) repeat protein